ncbi:alkaline phosphatase family protein [Actinokineospora iranica]|uniref:Phospholipase C n=1 Tax=Actinokineospora iranica TaxID=1271860 RepID=A0A1G6QF98_9PSEU|nr:phospholipase C [Actinokineospora iranica]
MDGHHGFEADGARAVTNAAYSYSHPGYSWTTYPERVEAAGVSWQIYQEWDSFTDNAVEYFAPFKAIGRKILTAVEGGFRTTEEFYDSLHARSADERARALRRFDAGVAALTPAERRLFQRGAYRSEPGTLVRRLRADIAARRLPRVSWLVPTAADSEHPGASTPVGSANLVYDVLDAIAADPLTWSKTVLLITFDENDGFFDHVPPPVPPRDDAEEHFDGQPLGLGPRVPMTIVSPWTVGGHVDPTVYDHTSVLRLLERWTGVRETNISAWRRTVAGDLTGAFDLTRPGRPPRLTRPGPVPAPIARWHPTPPDEQRAPTVEPGTRPARPVPYRTTVSGVLRPHGTLDLTLTNTGRASAHFAIYPYAGERPEPAHRDVSGSHTEPLTLAGAAYRVAVQGPNGSWWEFGGARDGGRRGRRPAAAPARRGGAGDRQLGAGGHPAARRRAVDPDGAGRGGAHRPRRLAGAPRPLRRAGHRRRRSRVPPHAHQPPLTGPTGGPACRGAR